jgi:hypothetical protein
MIALPFRRLLHCFELRLREELRRKLERDAAKRVHSLNAEMVERLEASYEREAEDRFLKALEITRIALLDDLKTELRHLFDEWKTNKPE